MPKAKPRAVEGRTSNYLHVSRQALRGRWIAWIRRGDRIMHIGAFMREIDAARAADRLALHLDGPAAALNFPRAKTKPASLAVLKAELRAARKKGTASKYLGVSHEPDNGLPWTARLALKKSLTLGRYATEREAAIARDRAVLFYKPTRTRLNFPRMKLTPASVEQLMEEHLRAKPARAGGVTARGVRWSGGAFIAQIGTGVRGKSQYLGSFATEKEAARAYERAAMKRDEKRRVERDPDIGDDMVVKR